ncbi:MAG: alpha-glucan family phosphorylase [Candidatus Magasanikbacteria bacterium]|jgi:glycogen phosphorylase|nr:alpha-glucan family phosphorylase [Candidatus Magasanikbacteria bacterium]MBT4221302.1 alpha-glucan family phosphorylase [Candidatus Magasanikbacteria bacterium]MBT4350850.1 alpha-glucan family phosphorylase [Candidatus Magasanikbacteria bacterium]MBT4542005.1 alpha-glucan family phosphorylase [Candidatus Magasanikbacteria bacterium]MBT6253426.1 alpha-glucan family phosphorylase [Candidatus Magasanikbacteria bacterium]
MTKKQENLEWFDTFYQNNAYSGLQERPIAYFCAEYGISQKMPIYAGGLGILAGDVMKEAGDRKIPMVGIGLYYYEGYVCNTSEMSNTCSTKDPESVGLKAVLNDKQEPLKISIPFCDATLTIKAWEWKCGDNSVYFLDTNVDENSKKDRQITNRLYTSDKEMRLKQEIVLGIGGLRLLETLGIHPSVYHLNEGHSAFLMFELIHHEMKERKISFDQAKQYAKRRAVFTNHTLVAAGNEVYSNDLVTLLLSAYAAEIGVPTKELVELGLVQESSTFSMTMLPLRMAGIINAVSKLHAIKAKDIWTSHPMIGITNGIHIPSWDHIKKDTDTKGGLFAIHQEKKKELLAYIKEKTGEEWNENHLLVGWARRFVQYKRPMALLEDPEGFKRMAENKDKPVRVVYAGRPHPDDVKGNEMRDKLKELIAGPLKGLVVYLPNYDIDVAQKLISGCDLWINTPIVGFEACGTSGMKAALNGVLPWSTKDGWIAEVELAQVGWEISDTNITKNILETCQNTIVPLYYERNEHNVPVTWENYMKNAREKILGDFSATRMIKEYIEMLYS